MKERDLPKGVYKSNQIGFKIPDRIAKYCSCIDLNRELKPNVAVGRLAI